MKNVCFTSAFAAAVLLLSGSYALAQTELHDSPSEHEVDSAHDTAENDPSIKPQLKLKKFIPQDRLMVTGTLKSISQNVARGVVAYSPLLLPITLMTKSEKPLTYADSVKSQPEIFKYFDIHQHRYTPKREYGPTLVNSDAEFEGISDRAHGYCWGFSTLVRYFSTLAFFDPSISKPAPTDQTGYKKWIEFYQHKIDTVVRGEATVIPGFANFRELSLVPELELYLKLNTMELWRSRAMNSSSLAVFRTAMDSMNYKQVDTLLNNLESRIARGEMPKIMFSSLIPSETILGMNTDIHVVLAYKVERLSKGRARIHLWDINFYAETLVRAPKFLEITEEHGILYAPWFEPTKTYAKGSDLVANVKIAPENDREVVQMLQSLKKFCANQKTARYCEQND
jgi:hypothetical protein